MRSEPYTNRAGYTFTPNVDSVIAADVFDVNECHLDWVLGQDRIWVDYWGHIHLVDAMPQQYLLNVFGLIHRYAATHDTTAVLESPLVERLHQILSEEPVNIVSLKLPGESETYEDQARIIDEDQARIIDEDQARIIDERNQFTPDTVYLWQRLKSALGR